MSNPTDPMFPSIDGLSQAAPTPEPSAPTYSQADLETYAARAVAADRAARSRPAPVSRPAAPASDLGAVVGQLVSLKIAEMVGGMGARPQPQNAIPVSDRGSPPVPSAPLEERPILQMTPAERDELVAKKGHGYYTTKLRGEMKNVRVIMR